MQNFWDSSVWGFFNVMAVLLGSLLAANVLKRSIPWLKRSLIPHSVLGGGLLIVVAGFYKLFTGEIMFDTQFFGGNGTALLELLTYHMLALGFIASALQTSGTKMTRQRTVEIFNTGVTTVSTYLLQAISVLPSPLWPRCWYRAFSPLPVCCCPLATVRAPVRL